MRAVHLSFLQMLASMRKDNMLCAICFVPILAGVLFRFAIPWLEAMVTKWYFVSAIFSPYYALIDLFFAMLTPTMFCFVSAMVALEEVDEKTTAYLFVTPLGKNGYLNARFFLPAVIAFLATIFLLPVFKLTSLSFLAIVVLAIAGTLQGIIISLMVVTFSSNKLEGMAIAKLSSLMLFGACIPFFIQNNMQMLCYPFPSFWMGKAIYENDWIYLFPVFVLSFLWIYSLVRKNLAKI